MRLIGWLLAILVVICWLASEVSLPRRPAASGREPDCWRRTRDGWEEASWVTPEISVRRPALHPSVVGLLELFLSMSALIVLPGRRPKGVSPKILGKRWEKTYQHVPADCCCHSERSLSF